jgi:pimeloyl-ACP methyl ester carboxylesterase
MRRRCLIAFAAVAPLAGCKSVQLNAPERTLFVNGPAGRLYTNDGGTGLRLPVLFVHSLGGSSSHWNEQLRYLRQSRRAVAFDLRGHGRSDAAVTQSAYLVDALAGDVAAVADALDLKRFVLVGHSLGGAVATAYAAANPRRVAGLVLVGTGGRMPASASMPMMQSLRADYARTIDKLWTEELAGARPEVATMLRREVQRMPRETMLALFGGLFSFDPLPALQAYPGPKVLIDAPRDSHLHEQQPLIPRRVIEGASHWPHLDKPYEFNAVLDDFLATVK